MAYIVGTGSLSEDGQDARKSVLASVASELDPAGRAALEAELREFAVDFTRNLLGRQKPGVTAGQMLSALDSPGLAKAARAVVYKSAGAGGGSFVGKKSKKRARALRKAAARRLVTKSALTVQCLVCGFGNRPGNNLCANCVEPMPGMVIPPLSDLASPHVNKAAFAERVWGGMYGNSPDPALREMVNKARYGGLNGGAA